MSGPPFGRRLIAIGLALGALVAGGGLLERAFGWTTPVFRSISQLFYEQSALAVLREPSQIALFRMHLLILGLYLAVGCVASTWLDRHGRRWVAVFGIGYAIRAAIWIAGSNLPLVPGDSSHYVEVASSILNGEGPVKHYVESYFRDYPRIRSDEGVLDDWATPLFSYLLAAAYRITGVVPGDNLEATFAIGKGLSFTLNLITLPILYVLTRRRLGPPIALGSMALLAILPVHALYAGFELRESLVVLMMFLAVGAFCELLSQPRGVSRYGWAIVAGLFMGLAILSRNTAMATTAACGVFGLIAGRGRNLGPLIVWGLTTNLIILPWAYRTFVEYGQPFYTYTQYFTYNFSWTVHHNVAGNKQFSQFFTRANTPAIIRTKLKSAVIVSIYSTMIFGLPVMIGFFRGLGKPRSEAFKNDRTDPWNRLTATIALVFVAATLANIADVTQVMQLGRYYVPLFVLMIPTAVQGLSTLQFRPRNRRLLACSLVALLWADPTWAYDFSWLSKTYQLHWPELWKSGEWVRNHPEIVPPKARIMTWFPWEFRLASRRPTILMNRSLHPVPVEKTIRIYGVTHLLWGSFEPPPDIDPEIWGSNLSKIRSVLRLSPSEEIWASKVASPFGTYPVTLYRLGGGSR